MPKDKPRGWYSEWHEQVLHPTVTVHEQEQEPARLVLPDGKELVAKKQIGFRPR
jgi:hypothetical protein